LASEVRSLGWNEKGDVPATDVVFTGATVLPMDDLSVIRDAVVHVKGNKIVAVGPRGQVDIPKNAAVYDVAGKTLMPGLVDVHAHTGSSRGGIHSQQSWAFLANLAFGVTTTHDPSNNTQMIFASSELVKAGKVVGPRIYSTGTILYGAEGDFKTVIDKLEDAEDAIHRTAAWGAFSVKSYNQPRREANGDRGGAQGWNHGGSRGRLDAACERHPFDRWTYHARTLDSRRAPLRSGASSALAIRYGIHTDARRGIRRHLG
jgi:imidazolonepropionase-like amidohydrolase